MEEKLKYSYSSMPKSKAKIPDMKIIRGNLENIRGRIVNEDIVYQRKNGINLKIRMVYPDFFQKIKKWPIVIHVQGSAWFKQNLNSHILDLKEIVTTGYILAIVEYSPLPEAVFPEQINDVKLAIEYLVAHSDELSIDVNNIFLSGDSSGGHTALFCWATWGRDALDGKIVDDFPVLKGCIDLYGVVDISTTPDYESAMDHNSLFSPEALLIGGVLPKEKPEIAEKVNVTNYLRMPGETAPLLVMHGNKDTVVPFEQSVQLVQCCKEENREVDFYCVDNADHGGNVFYCADVMKTIQSFLKKNTEV